MEERIDRVATGAMLFITGTAIGVGAALLLAPHSGKKTRREIGRFVGKALGRTETVAEEFAGTVRDVAESVSEKASGILESGREMSKDGKRKVVEAVDEAMERLRRERERFLKIAS